MHSGAANYDGRNGKVDLLTIEVGHQLGASWTVASDRIEIRLRVSTSATIASSFHVCLVRRKRPSVRRAGPGPNGPYPMVPSPLGRAPVVV